MLHPPRMLVVKLQHSCG